MKEDDKLLDELAVIAGVIFLVGVIVGLIGLYGVRRIVIT